MIAAAYLLPAAQALVTLPESVNLVGLLLICLLFSASLLRLGPRKFLRRLLGTFSIGHSHEHDNSHGHKHDSSPERDNRHEHSHKPENSHGHAHKPAQVHQHGSNDKPHHH
jgi:ABC-type nickel/cobalt efflux system permease component RcnA